MKKVVRLIIASLVIVIIMSGCSNAREVPSGTYVASNSDATVVIRENSEIMIAGPKEISAAFVGQYIYKGDEIIFNGIDDDEHVFLYKDGNIIYDCGKWMGNWVEEGTVFYSAAPVDALQIIREMMALDYADMTIAEFNTAIQDIARKHELTVFEVIAAAHDATALYDDNNEFIANVIEDQEVEAFLHMTLKYSAQDIIEAPGYLESIAYITAPNVTAKEMQEKKAQMTSAAYNAYLDGIVDEMTVHAEVFFQVEYLIPDPAELTVGQRDAKLNAIFSEMEAFVVAMSEDEVVAPDIEDRLTARLDELTEEYSDSSIHIICGLVDIEDVGDMA